MLRVITTGISKIQENAYYQQTRLRECFELLSGESVGQLRLNKIKEKLQVILFPWDNKSRTISPGIHLNEDSKGGYLKSDDFVVSLWIYRLLKQKLVT